MRPAVKRLAYSGCQKNVLVFKRFFFYNHLCRNSVIWVFLNRVLCTRLHPHRLRHCRAFVFFRHRQKKNMPPAPRVVGDSEHYYGKRYKIKSIHVNEHKASCLRSAGTCHRDWKRKLINLRYLETQLAKIEKAAHGGMCRLFE